MASRVPPRGEGRKDRLGGDVVVQEQPATRLGRAPQGGQELPQPGLGQISEAVAELDHQVELAEAAEVAHVATVEAHREPAASATPGACASASADMST